MKVIEIEWCSPEYQSALELRHQVLRAPLGLKLTAEELDGEHGQLHFGVNDGELIATLVARPLSTTLIQFRQMAVQPHRQGGGVGRLLIEFCEANLRERGFQEITLHSRLTAVPFYQKLGYKAEGDVFEEISLEHQKMVKRIAS